MKAEHRHQLHTNALADRMGRLLTGVRSAPKSTSMLIWIFVLLALATFAVWQYATSATVRERSALWTNVDEATHDPTGGATRLQMIETRDSGTLPGRTARFELARLNLQQGLASLARASLAREDRVQAYTLLASARRLYTELVPRCVDVPLLAQEAMMGRATAEESLVAVAEPAEATGNSAAGSSEPSKEEKRAGSLEQALEYYRELAKKYPESILGKKAEERVQEYEQQSSRSEREQFYAEANQKPAPKAILPSPGKVGP